MNFTTSLNQFHKIFCEKKQNIFPVCFKTRIFPKFVVRMNKFTKYFLLNVFRLRHPQGGPSVPKQTSRAHLTSQSVRFVWLVTAVSSPSQARSLTLSGLVGSPLCQHLLDSCASKQLYFTSQKSSILVWSPSTKIFHPPLPNLSILN